MSIAVGCKCGKRFKVKERMAGKAVRCPDCGGPIRIPGETAPAGAASAAGGSAGVDENAALLKFEEARKKKQIDAEADAAYKAEQNKLIESYDQIAGKKRDAKKVGKPSDPKPRKVTVFTKIADASGAVFGTLLAKYLIIAVLLGAGIYGSVRLVIFITSYMSEETDAPEMPIEDRITKLFEEADAALQAADYTEARRCLAEIKRLDRRKEVHRDFRRIEQAIRDAEKGTATTAPDG